MDHSAVKRRSWGAQARKWATVGLLAPVVALGGACQAESRRLPYSRQPTSERVLPSSADRTQTAGTVSSVDRTGSNNDGASREGTDGGTPAVTSSQPKLSVEFQGPPVIRHANSRTQVVVDLVVRDGEGKPLAEDAFEAVLLQAPAERQVTADDVLDIESLLEREATAVVSNLNFQLVLDASFSMLGHDPPAFEPMKEAAAGSIELVREVWAERGGTVTTGVLWFDQWLFHSDGEWDAEQIMSLEPPTSGTPTRLLGAVHYMVGQMQSQYAAGVAAGPRDRHVLLVFTDGKDNISSLDSTPMPVAPCQGYCSAETQAECQDGSLIAPCPNETTTGQCSATATPEARFYAMGYPCVDMQAVQKVSASHPNLVTHVVGLGSDVSQDELQAIADAGNGTTVFGNDSGSIRALFDEVLNQFVNVQSYGADIPQAQGDYRFGVRVEAPGSGQVICSFVYSTADGFSGEIAGAGCSLR